MTATLARPMTPLAANLICMVSMLVWAAGLPAAQILIGPLHPLPLTALRMAIAACVLLPLWIAMDGWSALRRARWDRGLLIGGAGFGFGAFLLMVGQDHSDAVTVAVISATMPVVGIALECLLDRRRLTPLLAVGLALGIAGGVWAYLGKIAEIGFSLGALASFASVVLFTLASRFTVTAFPDLSPIGRTTVTLTGAAVATVTAALLSPLWGAPAPEWGLIGAREVGAILIFAVLGMAVSQVLWIVSVEHLGVGTASLHINAAPFYVMLFVVALGGTWSGAQAVGAAIVAVGVLLAQAAPRRTRPA